MYKCPSCGGKIVAYFIYPEQGGVYDINSKPDEKGYLDMEYIGEINTIDSSEAVFNGCECYDCGEEFSANSLEEFGKNYAHLWSDEPDGFYSATNNIKEGEE